jgi:hypothetical protein
MHVSGHGSLGSQVWSQGVVAYGIKAAAYGHENPGDKGTRLWQRTQVAVHGKARRPPVQRAVCWSLNR